MNGEFNNLAAVDAFCLIFNIISNMAGGGLLDDVSTVWCLCFVGSDTSGKDAPNFCITSFHGCCISTTGSYLPVIVVGRLQLCVACFFTCFSGLSDVIFFPLNCLFDWSTLKGEF